MVNVNPKKHTAAGRRAGAAPSAERTGPRTVFSLSEDETFDLGQAFGRQLRGGELILLEGELGSGKTVFARGIAAGLGIPPEDVSSPSFTLVQEYTGGRVPMFHIDLYRIESPEDLESLGLDEILAAGAVVVVEWGERLPPYFRRDACAVNLHDAGEGSRRIELLPRPEATRPRSADA